MADEKTLPYFDNTNQLTIFKDNGYSFYQNVSSVYLTI